MVQAKKVKQIECKNDAQRMKKEQKGNFYCEKRDTEKQRKKRFFMADLTFVAGLGTSMKKHMKRNEWLSRKLSWEVSLFAAKLSYFASLLLQSRENP